MSDTLALCIHKVPAKFECHMCLLENSTNFKFEGVYKKFDRIADAINAIQKTHFELLQAWSLLNERISKIEACMIEQKKLKICERCNGAKNERYTPVPLPDGNFGWINCIPCNGKGIA